MHFDASYFESSIPDTEAETADLRCDVSVAIEGHLPLSCKPSVGCLVPCQLAFPAMRASKTWVP
jgi:hypothetical protein